MPFQIVVLWSDLLVWLLFASALGFALLVRRSPPLRSAWRRVGARRSGMAAATVLLCFALVGLLDSLHYRLRLPAATEPAGGSKASAQYAVEVLSLLDALAAPLRTRNEKTYSAPFATRLLAKETREVAGVGTVREQPRLKHGGAHLGENETELAADVGFTAFRYAALGFLGWALLTLALLSGLRRCAADWGTTSESWQQMVLAPEVKAKSQVFTVDREPGQKSELPGAWALLRGAAGGAGGAAGGGLAWDAVLAVLLLLALLLPPLFALAGDYHVFGTDKVGQDVLYQVLKSIRTGLIIGLVTTLVMLPLAVLLGIAAGYFRGWVDDLIQYLYTVLNSIPGVLLIAAAVLMMQVVIDTHPQWFSTAAERADLRLLALCFILGITSWTGLCRLLRGETLKLRELEYIQAAQAFGVSHARIIGRHILPNLMHIVVIALVMDFSGLVLAEAVLSYVGIGVDPTMTSFGTMINNARLELGREPVVWWSLAAAFATMFVLVLAANLFADAVRDAFDPRMQ
ncbi:ABC transporter permease [Dechloromonas sp. ZY10]